MALVLDALPDDERHILQQEAFRQAQILIGPLVKLREDSPVVASMLADLVRQRRSAQKDDLA
jgi:hypothetical protein